MRGIENEHSVSQFSRQPLIAFDPRFVFPDRPNTHKRLKRMQGPKVFRGANLRRLLLAWGTFPCHARDHSVSRISWQPQTLFVPRFVFPDRFSIHKHCGWTKKIRRVNHTMRFPAGLSSSVQCTSTINLTFSAIVDLFLASFRIAGRIQHA